MFPIYSNVDFQVRAEVKSRERADRSRRDVGAIDIALVEGAGAIALVAQVPSSRRFVWLAKLWLLSAGRAGERFRGCLELSQANVVKLRLVVLV